MKNIKHIILVLAAITAGTVSYGQRPYVQRSVQRSHERHSYPHHHEYRGTKLPQYSVRIEASTAPLIAQCLYFNGRVFGHDNYEPYYRYNNNALNDIYSDWHGPTSTTGALGISFEFAVTDWFSVSAALNTCFLWNDLYDGITSSFKGTDTGAAVYLYPKAKFIYHNRPSFRIYGSVGIGCAKYFGFKELREEYVVNGRTFYEDNSFRPVFQFSPVGVELGHTIYGFAELGMGTVYYGIQAGVGYRF